MAVDGEAFVAAVSPAIRQAAAIARALEGRVPNRPKKDETSAIKQALTLADTAAQEALLVALLEHFPDVSLEAEEDTPTVAEFPRSSPWVVVIDPIDGTLQNYLGGQGPYAVMVGLVHRGRYEAGLVALPREGIFFDAVRGKGARSSVAGGPPRGARLATDGKRVLISHAVPESVWDALVAEGIDVVPACGGAVAVAPMVRGARAGIRRQPDEGGISIRGRLAAFVAREAGCVVLGRDGRDFPEELDEPSAWLISTRTQDEARSILATLDRLDLA